MRRCSGFTFMGLIAILTVMGLLSTIVMKLKINNQREVELINVAESIFKVAQSYDQYYLTNCGTSFTVPSVSALGVDSSITSGFVNASPLTLGSKVSAGGLKYLTISSTFANKRDALTSAGILGQGAVLGGDNKTITYSFLPSLNSNSQSRKNWFGGVNCF
jgi:type II secretory pathway pseudopilin PulG